MSVGARTPVIIGVAQKTISKASLPGPEPLAAWKEVAKAAAADAGVAAEALAGIKALAVADCMSWPYDDRVARVAEALGANPTSRYAGPGSGTSGQTLLNSCADDIRSGKADMALICGGESLATVKHYKKLGQMPPWSFANPELLVNKVNPHANQHPSEVAVGLFAGVGAVYGFAMRDVARRAHLGIAPDAYRRQLGDLLSSMTEVAAQNPDAWFKESHDADFLITPRDDNRMITYPYTKHMVAIIDVDISAAILMVSEEKADELGVPREKRVYPWTSGYAEDPTYIAVRANLWRSDAMAAASAATFEAAGLSVNDMSYIDLYSCFAAAVNFSRDALGITDKPGNKITVTGGLPYAGGPASSYVLTSIVGMVRKLRADPKAKGLVSGLGKKMTNHVYGVYAAYPPGANVKQVDQAAVQAKVDAIPQRRIDAAYVGPVKVATYTVMHDSKGAISHGAAICDLPNGDRAYARMLDKDLLADGERIELVGQQMTIREGEGVGELVRASA